MSLPAGAEAFARLDDPSALTEIAPQHPEALDVLFFAWLGATSSEDNDGLERASRIDSGMLALTLAFKGTDSVKLLAFVGRVLRDLDTHVCVPHQPSSGNLPHHTQPKLTWCDQPLVFCSDFTAVSRMGPPSYSLHPRFSCQTPLG